MAREPTTEIRDILATKVQQATDGDFYALLDLPNNADDKLIKESYFRLARLVHPDSLQKQSLADRKQDAAFVFEKVTEAYQTLIDPSGRDAYLRARDNGTVAPTARDEGKMAAEAAKIALHQGKMMLNRRAYNEAEEYFSQLTELKPDDARGFLFLGWCLFQNKERELEKRLEQAKAAFTKALNLDPKNADGHYYLSLYYKEKNNLEQVRKHLNSALKTKPDHVAAQREMRLLDMRRPSEPGQQSISDFLKGFFSKKGPKK